MDESNPLVSSEQAVYREIAEANLLRLRGSYDEAKALCHSILKRHPEDATVYTLMGDVCQDADELDRSIQWYEMAMEVEGPGSAAAKRLSQALKRLEDRDSAQTAARLGIERKPARTWPIILTTTLGIGALVIAAFLSGLFTQPAAPERSDSRPIMLDEPKVGRADEPAAKQDPVGNPDAPVESPPAVGSDASLLGILQARGAERVVFLSAEHDPRGPEARLTVQASEGETLAVTALRAALALYRETSVYVRASIRVVSKGEVAFVADVTKEAAETAQTAISGGDTWETQSEVTLGAPWSIKSD